VVAQRNQLQHRLKVISLRLEDAIFDPIIQFRAMSATSQNETLSLTLSV
jgi:hypothetical protein